MRGIAREVDAGELLFELDSFLSEFVQRCLDGLDLLPFGRDVVARVCLLPLLSASFVAAGVASGFWCSGRRGGAAALFQPVRVVLEVSLEVGDRAIGHQPELVADAAQKAAIM